MTTNEHISRLQEAQDLLREALDILEDVQHETDHGMAGAYILPHLRIMIDNDHGYMSRDYNIEDWIKDLREDDDEDTEDGEPWTDDDDDFVAYIPPPPTDPSTFPHTPEFAAKLYAAHKDHNSWKIPAIKDYRAEYGVGLKVAKDAVEYIFDLYQSPIVDQPALPDDEDIEEGEPMEETEFIKRLIVVVALYSAGADSYSRTIEDLSIDVSESQWERVLAALDDVNIALGETEKATEYQRQQRSILLAKRQS